MINSRLYNKRENILNSSLYQKNLTLKYEPSVCTHERSVYLCVHMLHSLWYDLLLLFYMQTIIPMINNMTNSGIFMHDGEFISSDVDVSIDGSDNTIKFKYHDSVGALHYSIKNLLDVKFLKDRNNIIDSVLFSNGIVVWENNFC